MDFKHQFVSRSYRGQEFGPEGSIKHVLVVFANIDLTSDAKRTDELLHATVDYVKSRNIDSTVFVQDEIKFND